MNLLRQVTKIDHEGLAPNTVRRRPRRRRPKGQNRELKSRLTGGDSLQPEGRGQETELPAEKGKSSTQVTEHFLKDIELNGESNYRAYKKRTISYVLWNRTQNNKVQKKIENVESTKIYSCCKTKGTINKIKEQATNWERCLVCK